MYDADSLHLEPPIRRAVIALAAIVLPNLPNKVLTESVEIVAPIENIVDDNRYLLLLLRTIRGLLNKLIDGFCLKCRHHPGLLTKLFDEDLCFTHPYSLNIYCLV
jgi:hypothetical protein